MRTVAWMLALMTGCTAVCEPGIEVRDATETASDDDLAWLRALVDTFDAETRVPMCFDVVVWPRDTLVDRDDGTVTARMSRDALGGDWRGDRRARAVLCEAAAQTHPELLRTPRLSWDADETLSLHTREDLDASERAWILACSSGRRVSAEVWRGLYAACGLPTWDTAMEEVATGLWREDLSPPMVWSELELGDPVRITPSGTHVVFFEPLLTRTVDPLGAQFTLDGTPIRLPPEAETVLGVLDGDPVFREVGGDAVLVRRDGALTRHPFPGVYGGVPVEGGLLFSRDGVVRLFDGETFTDVTPYRATDAFSVRYGSPRGGASGGPFHIDRLTKSFAFELVDDGHRRPLAAVGIPIRGPDGSLWSVRDVGEATVVVRELPDGSAVAGALCFRIDSHVSLVRYRGEVVLTWWEDGAFGVPIRLDP